MAEPLYRGIVTVFKGVFRGLGSLRPLPGTKQHGRLARYLEGIRASRLAAQRRLCPSR